MNCSYMLSLNYIYGQKNKTTNEKWHQWELTNHSKWMVGTINGSAETCDYKQKSSWAGLETMD